MINAINTTQSAQLIEHLSKPTAAYKNSARLAVAGLLVFVGLYFGLAGWFLYTAYRLTIGAEGHADKVVWGYCVAVTAAFLAVFMLKAIFSVKNARPEGLHELAESEQPGLFAFLHQLADAAGAPRPHKVFLSSRVNAAVFYDLSLFNLFFPSKKNLEIGLALVNALTLGELRAVLAHEFGHFAQRSMAVGRWVYVAQQIAGHLVARRDKLEDFLVSVGNIDFRIRAVVAVVQLIIWSIRSLVDSVFSVVVLMQRALSREMEMQADLVAVSLTGSDALVHALHRLQAADDAWERSLRFVHGELAAGRITRDAFAVQTHMQDRMAMILGDDAYGKVPAVPQQQPEQHRVFKAELAQPPRMWLTHPLNHEREANAKRLYVAAPIDQTSAWSVFAQPLQLREQMTAQLLGDTGEAQPVDIEATLTRLGKQFGREYLNRRYCGVYLGRDLARHADRLAQLRDPRLAASIDHMARLYPDSLKADMQRMRTLESEIGQISALIAGRMTAPGRAVQLRGEEFKLKQLPAALARVRQEMAETARQLQEHDHFCRSWHQAMAARIGGNWQPYLDGLLALIHYAEHTEADLRDMQALLRNTTQVVTAVRRVNDKGVVKIIAHANDLHYLLEQIFAQAPTLLIDDALVARLELSGNWSGMLGEFKLPMAGRDNINDWLGAIDGWVGHVGGCLSSLRGAALEQLLVTETMIARHSRSGQPPDDAPAPSRAPASFPVLLPGAERKQQDKLGWWARFQRAEGIFPGMMRLLVALGIVGVVLGVGGVSRTATIKLVNGLGLPVVVNIDGVQVELGANAVGQLETAARRSHHVVTKTRQGQAIEEFDGPASEQTFGDNVYSVAGATPLVIWTANYGNAAPVAPRKIGAPRWTSSDTDVFFADAPTSISTKGGGGTRTVFDGALKQSPGVQLSMLDDAKERERISVAHARWDGSNKVYTTQWLEIARATTPAILAERLAQAPNDVPLLRAEQDFATPEQRVALCAQTAARAAQAPDNPDLHYLALRCKPNGPALDEEFAAAHDRWPANLWLTYAAAHGILRSKNWTAAAPLLEKVRSGLPPMAHEASMSLALIRRFEGKNPAPLAATSETLGRLLNLEKEVAAAGKPTNAYIALGRGNIAQALDFKSDSANDDARLLRLAAASEGASAAVIQRMLALPVQQGLDSSTGLVSVAVAMKAGQDAKAVLAAAKPMYGPYGDALQGFLQHVGSGADPTRAEALLDNMPPDVRGLAIAAGITLLGRKAPPAWRQFSQRVLFVTDRPYFV